MGNLTTGFKKFLQNKNTVTVVGVILAIVVLYFAYTIRIKSAINPIPVPYAVKQINAGTQITEGMIGTREVPPSMIKGDVILNKGEIIDKYASVDTVIPAGSLFYKRAVVEKEQLPANIILEYPKGYVMLYMGVEKGHTGLGKALVYSIMLELMESNLPSIAALVRDGKINAKYAEEMISSQYEYVLLERDVK